MLVQNYGKIFIINSPLSEFRFLSKYIHLIWKNSATKLKEMRYIGFIPDLKKVTWISYLVISHHIYLTMLYSFLEGLPKIYKCIYVSWEMINFSIYVLRMLKIDTVVSIFSMKLQHNINMRFFSFHQWSAAFNNCFYDTNWLVQIILFVN